RGTAKFSAVPRFSFASLRELRAAGLVVEDGPPSGGQRHHREQRLHDDAVAGRRAVRRCTNMIGKLRSKHFLETGALSSGLVLVAFSHSVQSLSTRSWRSKFRRRATL